METQSPTQLKSPVPAKYSGFKLLDYLCARFPYQSRDAWQALIMAGKVEVNGGRAAGGRGLAKGDLVAYTVVLKEPPVNTDIRILHQEAGFLVASKPGQLPSHADGTFIRNTFIALINQRLDPAHPAKLVHRLDRETSGVMVLALEKESHKSLTKQFEAGGVAKTYLALCIGRIPEDSFKVEGLLGRDPKSQVSIRHALLPEGSADAKQSLTEFEVQERFAAHTLVRCHPRTGRTNQIRVHLAHAGYPIYGDKLYGRSDEDFLAFIAHVKAGGDPGFCPPLPLPRQFLHAWKLGFKHPSTGAALSFEAPLPDDLEACLDSLRA